MGGDDLAPAGGVADTLRRSLASMGDDLAPAGGANGRYADEPGGGGGGAPASEETDGFSLDLDLALARAEDAGAGRPVELAQALRCGQDTIAAINCKRWVGCYPQPAQRGGRPWRRASILGEAARYPHWPADLREPVGFLADKLPKGFVSQLPSYSVVESHKLSLFLPFPLFIYGRQGELVVNLVQVDGAGGRLAVDHLLESFDMRQCARPVPPSARPSRASTRAAPLRASQVRRRADRRPGHERRLPLRPGRAVRRPAAAPRLWRVRRARRRAPPVVCARRQVLGAWLAAVERRGSVCARAARRGEGVSERIAFVHAPAPVARMCSSRRHLHPPARRGRGGRTHFTNRQTIPFIISPCSGTPSFACARGEAWASCSDEHKGKKKRRMILEESKKRKWKRKAMLESEMRQAAQGAKGFRWLRESARRLGVRLSCR